MELLDAGGLDPGILKTNLHRRALQLREQCDRMGQNPPHLLERMIGDLASPTTSQESDGVVSVERQWIIKLLNDIRQLPQRLHAGFEPSFSNAYRNKKELSAADKKMLDRIAEEMKQSLKESR